MALVLSDRVKETCTSPGTGAVTLLGAATGYQSFLSGVGDGNTCYYCIADQGGANWEVGLGTYTASGNTLTRTTPYAGSSATPVDFSSGTQTVFVTYPASKSVNKDASSNVLLGTAPSFSSTSTSGAFATDGMAIYPYNTVSGTSNTVINSGVASNGSGTVPNNATAYYGYVSSPALTYTSTATPQYSGGFYSEPVVVSTTSNARVNLAGARILVARQNANDTTTSTVGTTDGIFCVVSTSTPLPSTTRIGTLRGMLLNTTVNGGYPGAVTGASIGVSNRLRSEGGTTVTTGTSISASLAHESTASATSTSSSLSTLTLGLGATMTSSVGDTGTLTIDNLYGVNLSSMNASSSASGSLNITNAYAIRLTGYNLSAGVSTPLNVTNAYSLYMAADVTTSGVTVTNRWGIYQAGAYKNYFAGNVLIGNTTGTSPLTVTGVIESTTGGFKFPDGTTQTTAASGSSDANNLLGGDAGQVPYQSAPDTTAFTAAGTTGQAFISGGTGSPTWGTLGESGGGTGLTALGSGVATWLGTPSSANLAAAVTGETGSGALVFGTSPTLTTPLVTGGKETQVAMAANDIDLAAGNYFTKTITTTTTFTVSNVPTSGQVASFILVLTNAGSQTINWSTSFGGTGVIKWAGGTSPTLTASGIDSLGFYTFNGGTTWTGLVLGKDIK